MSRLRWQVQATIVASLALFALLLSLAWRALHDEPPEQRIVDALPEIVGALAAAAGSSPHARVPADVHAVLAALAARHDVELTLRDPSGALLAATSEPSAFLSPGLERGAPEPRRHGPMPLVARLADGRWLLVAPREAHRRLGLALGVMLLGAAVALGSVPIVRRTTRRLERLQARVEQLGTGDLAARVEVEGRDEIAGLASAFNRAAERIERLVAAQRTLLASASHELRSPLARIRLALEWVDERARPGLRAELERDVAILDARIGELLLASRVEAFASAATGIELDLLALAAEECARAGIACEGRTAPVRGGETLLRALVRNLLDNARRHAGGEGVEVHVAPVADGRVRLVVDDRGPGVAPAERERIFEPFHRPAGAREGAGGEGLGLGLALVARIAVLHGGAARCGERPGGGGRFEVDLPAAPGAVRSIEPGFATLARSSR